MPEHPTPPGPFEDPGAAPDDLDLQDRTSVTTADGNEAARYTAPSAPAATATAPRPPAGGRRRWAGRIVAVVALAVAIFVAGAAVALHFSSSGVSTTASTRPAAGATPQAPSLGYGSGGAPSAGAGGSTSAVDATAVAAKVSPALVNITVSNSYTSSGGAASGIVLSSDGYVLTNNHVVNGATDIKATDVGNGKTYAATVVGYDATKDIALIKLDGASGLATAGIGDSGSLSVGDTVVGVGNAGGDGGAPKVAAGTVLALDQQIVASDQAGGSAERLSGLIQTDADIRSGDSGGALVDAGGTVIGVMTAASATNGSNFGYGPSGTEGYAVPIDTAMQVVNQIRSGQASATVHLGQTGFLGVQTIDTGAQGASGSGDPYGYGFGDPYGYGSGGNGSGGQPSTAGTGALVAGVISGSPAAKAGLVAGDVITAVDAAAVTSATDLSSQIAAHHPGDTVSLTWIDRSGSRHSATVTLIQGPAK
jgi:S1-C subfamily serine protease